jgi:hypothetical protein
VNSFGKAFAYVRNCLLMKKAHGTNRIVEEQAHWRILYENDTKRRIQQALCKNKKKDVIPTYSIFQFTYDIMKNFNCN